MPSQPNQGMFGGGGGSSFSPTLNPGQWGQAQYDFSGIQKGAQALQNAPALNIPKYNPYMFSTPNYGRSSDQEIGNTYNQAYNTGAKPLIAQGQEAMRGLSQGFGANSIGNAAAKTMQLRGAQNTGNSLQNLSGSIGSQLADRRLTQDETARSQMFGANMQNQQNQSNANYQAAGFNADSAQRMSQDAVGRAGQMLQYGMALPALQSNLNQSGMAPYMTAMDQAMKMANNTVPPGTNVQSGGGKKG